jgi:pimeloyl-ACP methyl ester carboxylesterase
MGLTGGYFLTVVVVAVVALPVGTVLLWNRVRGPRPARGVQRFGLIGLCQLSAVLLAALIINNSFQLYTSWSDLFGWDGAPGQIQGAVPVVTGGLLKSQTGGRSLPNADQFHPYEPVANAFTATVTGPASKVTGTVMVWLPPQYDEAGYEHAYFPVVQLFSGFPGSAATWFNSMAAPGILTQEIAAHKAQPLVLVSASINVDPPHNADCSDVPGGPRVATWLAEDVHQLVETSFRTATGRTGWGLMGFSEGGLCASKLALQYPDEYAAAVSMSGDDHPGGDLLAPGTAAYNLNSPLWILEHEPPRPVSLLLTGTLQDGATASEAVAMKNAAKAPATVSLLIAPRGGHNIGVWKAMEPQAFDWLSGRLGKTGAGPIQVAPRLIGGKR